MLRDGAVEELERVLGELGRSPIDDPQKEHASLALDWLAAYGRCLVTGFDLTKYGYPRPMWAARGLHAAKGQMQPFITQARHLDQVLAINGFLAFRDTLMTVFDYRVKLWAVEMTARDVRQQALKTSLHNLAVYVGLRDLNADSERYDRALKKHVDLIQSLDECQLLAQKYRLEVCPKYQATLPWCLAGGFEASPLFGEVIQTKLAVEAGQHGLREA